MRRNCGVRKKNLLEKLKYGDHKEAVARKNKKDNKKGLDPCAEVWKDTWREHDGRGVYIEEVKRLAVTLGRPCRPMSIKTEWHKRE